MADSFTQDNRPLTISTPLGDNTVLITGLRGREEMSKPFEFTLELVSTTLTLDATSIVGKAVTVTILLPNGTDQRYVNGTVLDFSAGELDTSGGVRVYRATIVPWFSLLKFASNCQIFQQKSIPDIIEAIFSDLGCSDYEKQLTQTYAALDYCVQYQETHFDFVCRLMEAAGIFYFFKHTDGKHTMVLADDASKYAACTENSVSYYGDFDSSIAGRITSWEHAFRFTSGKYTLTDYNFETPTTDLKATESTVISLSGVSSYEQFDYPGKYLTTSDGTSLSKVRMQIYEWPYEVVRGTSSCASFNPAGTFEVSDHPIDSEKSKSFVVLAVEHDIAAPVQYMSETIGRKSKGYSNRFECIPSSVVYRPPRVTPRPHIRGPQSALVVGSSGQEMLTDKYGRVKVQFYWDRVGQKDENSSCWIRVAQNLAGNTWGMQFLPRIGQEVLVEFLDGDPDRPIITGSVYNADQMPTYALPDSQNKSGLRTRSTTEGSDQTFNELTFDDTKGSEQIYFHAEKDFVREVENNDSLKVGYDVKNPGDQTIQIYNNRTVTLENGTDSLDVQTGDRTVTIDKGNDSLTVSEGNRTITISKGNVSVTISEGNETVTLSKGNQTTTLDKGNQSLTLSGGNRSATLSKGNDTVTLSAGNYSLECSSGSATISGMQGVTLKCGSNSIEISPSGVTIKGTMITLEGQSQVSVKGPMVQVNGSGMVQVQGGMITLN